MNKYLHNFGQNATRRRNYMYNTEKFHQQIKFGGQVLHKQFPLVSLPTHKIINFSRTSEQAYKETMGALT
jgi:hypothetical protein